MADKKLVSIMMAASPNRTEYIVGFTSLEMDGGMLNLIYDDNTFEQIPFSDKMGYYVDNTKLGDQIVTVEYRGCKTMFHVNVRGPRLTKVSIVTPQTRSSYMEGEKLDLSGLKLMGTYDDGADREVPVPELDYTVKLGDAVVPLSVDGLLIPIMVQVRPCPVTTISMKSMPNKLTYIAAEEEFDPSGGIVEKTYENGAVECVPLTKEMVSGFDGLEEGAHTIKITIDACFCELQVNILPKQPIHLEILSLPIKQTYVEGEPYDLIGLAVKATKGGQEWGVDISQIVLSEPVASISHSHIYGTYEGTTIEIPVTVTGKALIAVRISAMPAKLEYLEGKDLLDLSGCQLEALYSDKTTETVPVTMDMVSGFDNNTAGDIQVTIRYQGHDATMPLRIKSKTIIGLTVTTPPDKTSYAVGEPFDPSGMKVFALYDNGALLPVPRYDMQPRGALRAGTTAIIVAYMEKTAVVPIEVTETKKEEKKQFLKAEHFYPSSLDWRFLDEDTEESIALDP